MTNNNVNNVQWQIEKRLLIEKFEADLDEPPLLKSFDDGYDGMRKLTLGAAMKECNRIQVQDGTTAYIKLDGRWNFVRMKELPSGQLVCITQKSCQNKKETFI